jgi:hypothetical protein
MKYHDLAKATSAALQHLTGLTAERRVSGWPKQAVRENERND